MTVQNFQNILTRLTRKLSRGLISAFGASILLVGLSACDDKNEPMSSGPQLPDGRTFISVLISPDAPGGRADAVEGPTWGDFYKSDAGNDFEIKIRQDRVHVAILKADGTPVGYNQDGVPKGNYYTGDVGDDIFILPMPGNEKTFYAYVDVTDLDLEEGKEYIFVVTANYGNNSVPAISQISNTTFALDSLINHKTGEIADPAEYYKGSIPMFGVMRWKYGTLEKPDGYFDKSTIGTVHLLRSVCKIEVLLPTEAQSEIAPYLEFNNEIQPHLAFVSGKHINTTGFVTPKKENWLLPSIKTTQDLTFLNSYNERMVTEKRWKSNDEKDTNLYLPATIKNEDGRIIGYYIYLPEATGKSMEPYEDALRLNVSVKYTPPIVRAGDGTNILPYNVSQSINLTQDEIDLINPEVGAWVQGYIVGYYDADNDEIVTSATGATALNVVIAAKANETDENLMVVVQLPTGDIRNAVNLASNPENLGKRLRIQGMIVNNAGNPGVNSVKDFELNDARTVTGTLFPSIPYDEVNQRYPNNTDYNNWSLYRNHIYRFTIKAVSNETSFDYSVSVSGTQTVDVPTFE